MLGSIIVTLLIGIPLVLIVAKLHDDNLKKEIARVIEQRGGQVILIEKMNVEKDLTPFESEAGNYNIVFKIEYTIGNTRHIAWYRGVKTINNIHDQSPGGGFDNRYGEKWIFGDQ
ncbi:hypothetical protein DL346_08700 [Paenibacillus montanisoli]|uniref:DUF3139 domain-containing protein n=2 Tax=Paenibacillus montanisoli TaxID=2081970 RepID=A0A328U9C2_9BACL|nr:hypothetical protein DL346_08700 [Paenibacillus montanisoli]